MFSRIDHWRDLQENFDDGPEMLRVKFAFGSAGRWRGNNSASWCFGLDIPSEFTGSICVGPSDQPG